MCRLPTVKLEGYQEMFSPNAGCWCEMYKGTLPTGQVWVIMSMAVDRKDYRQWIWNLHGMRTARLSRGTRGPDGVGTAQGSKVRSFQASTKALPRRQGSTLNRYPVLEHQKLIAWSGNSIKPDPEEAEGNDGFLDWSEGAGISFCYVSVSDHHKGTEATIEIGTLQDCWGTLEFKQTRASRTE